MVQLIERDVENGHNLPATDHLELARSFLDDGLNDRALSEIELLPKSDQFRSDALIIKLEVFRKNAMWAEMIVSAIHLRSVEPQTARWWVFLAYAVRRTSGVRLAKQILLSALASHSNSGDVHYFLACCNCSENDLALARYHASEALRLDPDLRRPFADDPDLAPLRASS